METRFTVSFFKRVITFSVLFIILLLLALTIFFKVKYDNAIDKNAVYADDTVKIEKESLDYQNAYSDMHVTRSDKIVKNEEKTVYLTFDDGPSTEITEKVLDVLKEYDIKATFFMVYKDSEASKQIIQRVLDEGHTIGIHSASHNYDKIYQSVDAYLEDFNKMDEYLKTEFDYTTTIFRFPGGSINSYNLAIYDQIVPEMYRRGYTFYDWNVASGDASNSYISAKSIESNVVNGVENHDKSIVLMHDSDGKATTLAALPNIIETLLGEGYTFKKLDNSIAPIVFYGE